MYKVIAVDDETPVIKSLKASVNWHEYGFEFIGEANNGLDAYELILKLEPDIVFVDIRMPGMSGLELIKKVNTLSLETLFVVISGYAEFAYAQKAMNYGAVGYCLKPFDDVEIISVLKKAASILGKMAVTRETEFFLLIDDDSLEGQSKRRDILKAYGFCDNIGKKILALVSIGSGRLALPEEIRFIALKIGSNKNACLLQYDAEMPIEEHFKNIILPEIITSVGISKGYNSLDSINEVVEEASIAVKQFFMTGKRGIYEYNDFISQDLNDAIVELEAAVDKKETDLIKNALDLFKTLFSRGNCNIKHAYQVYNIVMYSLHNLGSEKYEDYIYSCEQLTDCFAGVQEMLEYLKSMLTGYSGIKLNTPAAEARNTLFKSILHYMNENFCKDISIQSIAQELSINPSYICQLFKKETGGTFTDSLTKLRIEYACYLLKNTSLSINKIVEKTGYNDYFYFARVFKKITGKTPTCYRGESK